MAMSGRNLLLIFAGKATADLSGGLAIPLEVKLTAWTDHFDVNEALEEARGGRSISHVSIDMWGFEPKEKRPTLRFRVPHTEEEVELALLWIRATGSWFCLLEDFPPVLPEGEEAEQSFARELLRTIMAKTFPHQVIRVALSLPLGGARVFTSSGCEL